MAGAKLLISLIGSGAAARKRKPKGSTLFNHFCETKRLVVWMSGRQLRTFRELSLAHIVGYRNHLRTRLVPTRGANKVKGATKLTAVATQTATLQTVLFLVRLQDKMGALGTHVELHEAEDILQSSGSEAAAPTPRIPDHIFRSLISAAIGIVRDVAPAVIGLEREFRDWRIAGVEKGMPSSMRLAYSYFRTYGLGQNAPSRIVEIGGRQIDLLSLDHHELRRLLMAIRAACFVLVAGLVGMRVSEIRSLRTGCLRSETLRDGRQLLRLHGTLFKTAKRDRGEPAACVAGWDEEQNPIALAIRCLEELSAGTGLLFGRFAGGADWIIQSQTVRHSLETLLELVNLPVDWHFSSHQFRKTFARFVALSGPSAAVALMRHFKHVSIQMTERYFPNDPELLNDIIEASEELIAERLTRVLSADQLGGIRGQEIVARNQAYRGEQHAADLADLVKLTMSDPSTHIVLHVYGMCFYESESAKCGGDIAEVGLSTCVRCVNFATGEEHIPFWKEQSQRLYANIDAHKENGEHSDLQRQLDEANETLARLGVTRG